MEIDQTFLDAIAAVESGGDDGAIGACGGVGRYQIRAGYLADGNAALGTRYTLAEMHDPAKAARIVTAYLTRYGSAWERRTGHEATAADLARIHNGGPRGAERYATVGYSMRFLAALGRNAK
jgi:soluble lytic murein transglycosylase-like protein